jgi:hypothetical protein
MTEIGFFTRRRFLEEVGAGMLFASLGTDVLRGLGRPLACLDRDDDRLDFGPLEPLARLMQDTPADKIVAACVEKLKSGTTLDTLIGASALANARTFGGEDYTGYHCEMALMPARLMASKMPDKRLAALPVLKVIHRNTAHMQEKGGHEKEVLRRPPAGTPMKEGQSLDRGPLLAAERKGDVAAAEAAFANILASGPDPQLVAIEFMQPLVRDTLDVHQVVLAWRAYDLISVAGKEHAHTLLRQSLRHCVANEGRRVRDGGPVPEIRDLLPRLIEEHRLQHGPGGGGKEPSDTEVEGLARTIFSGTREEAARAAAPAIQSITSMAVGEAISLAAVRLLLHDPGQTKESVGKPVGTVHGASVGVHASDAADAWNNLARVGNCRTIAANLITGAWHTAGQSGHMDKEKPMHAAARDRAAAVAAKDLPGAIEESIRGRDQLAAAALVERWGKLGVEPAPLIEKLLAHAVEHDGALHHEKFFATAIEGFTKSRPAFRFEYLAGLARVLASGYGFEARGLKEARERLLA